MWDVDFAAWADQLGLEQDATDWTVRVVLEDCDRGRPQLPAQFVDGVRALTEPASHDDPLGDGRGVLTGIWELDGDLSTRETLGVSGVVTLGVYFAPGADPQAADTLDLTVRHDGAVTEVTAGGTTAVFDADRGGLIADLGLAGASPVASQARVCCGNGMHFWQRDADVVGATPGWVVPQGAPADVEVVAEGPVWFGWRSSGTVEAVRYDGEPFGSYDYEVWSWRFAGRPEVWQEVTHVATSDCTTEHPDEASLGFRPVQLSHRLADEQDTVWVADQDVRRAAVHTASEGVAMGLYRAPAEFARMSNPLGALVGSEVVVEQMAIHGSERVEAGVLSPVTVPAGEVIFERVGVHLLPFDGDWSAANAELAGLAQLVTFMAPCAESETARTCTASR
jgi:hypothetical protein